MSASLDSHVKDGGYAIPAQRGDRIREIYTLEARCVPCSGPHLFRGGPAARVGSLTNLLENVILQIPLSTEFMAKNLTLAIAVGIVMLWNFFVNRYWTYNDID